MGESTQAFWEAHGDLGGSRGLGASLDGRPCCLSSYFPSRYEGSSGLPRGEVTARGRA